MLPRVAVTITELASAEMCVVRRNFLEDIFIEENVFLSFSIVSRVDHEENSHDFWVLKNCPHSRLFQGLTSLPLAHKSLARTSQNHLRAKRQH